MNESKVPAVKDVLVTIGVIPFEKFSGTAAVIESLIVGTDVPFQLYVVDGNMPSRYRFEISVLLKQYGFSNYRFLPSSGYLTSNQGKNLVIRETRTPYLFLIENNCLAQPGYLVPLLEASSQLSDSALISCLQLESLDPPKIHHEPEFCNFSKHEENGKILRRPLFDRRVLERVNWSSPAVVETIEPHALFAPTALFRRAGAFDDRINTRFHYDVTFAIEEKGISMVLQPESKVLYEPPRTISEDEREYSEFLFDGQWAARSNKLLREKWNCPDMLDSTVHIVNRKYRRSVEEWKLHAEGKITYFYNKKPTVVDSVGDITEGAVVSTMDVACTFRLSESAQLLLRLCDGKRTSREIGYLIKNGIADDSVPILNHTIDTLDSLQKAGLIVFNN